MATSVVVIGEYLVKGEKSELPLRDVQLLPYNLPDAELAAKYARRLFEARSSGIFETDQRPIIPNDVKIFASTELSGAIALVTADERSEKAHAILRDAGLVSFDLWKISKTLAENRGVLDLGS
jgi:predicted nucleic acid-binding protein